MINLPKEKCCGCGACYNICPKGAISMRPDECGYVYPHIDQQICIDCGLCDKVCPEFRDKSFNDPQSVYALVGKDKEFHQESASGGFATILGREIVRQGGVVYGCSEKNFYTIRHIRVEKEKDLSLLRNSKYVHSDIKRTYEEAKNDLKKKRKVLFTGTPCQIAGLYGYLGKRYDNLLTMDLVCHGVPPMRMLKEQVLSYPEIKGICPEDIWVDFRWKIQSGSYKGIHYGLRTAVRNGDGSYKVLREEDDIINAYMRCFQTGISLREHCFQCPYTVKKRISDITAADFWGIGSVVSSSMYDQRGVSLILLNTDNGILHFDSVKKYFEIERHSFEEAALSNRCLSAPLARLSQRDEFLRIYRKKGLFAAAKATDPRHRFESMKLVRFLRGNRILNFGLRLVGKIIRVIRINR